MLNHFGTGMAFTSLGFLAWSFYLPSSLYQALAISAAVLFGFAANAVDENKRTKNDDSDR